MSDFVVIPEYGVAYCHVPRAASTTILGAFGLALGLPNADTPHRIEFQRCAGKDVDPRLHRFAVVRNPYSRLVSYWGALRKNASRALRVKQTAVPIDADTPFHEFLEQVCNVPIDTRDGHLRRIVDITGYAKRIDRVIRFERLDVEWNLLCQAYPRVPLLRERRNVSSHGPWLGYYNQKMLNRVYERYEDDFTLFGYRREFV